MDVKTPTKQIATFGCTALAGVNKTGILTPDKNGYYEQVLGAFNFYNSQGQIYPFEAAKHIFDASSDFMRRVKNGMLYGENGHPKREPGWTDRDYLTRILTIEETNHACHFADIRISFGEVKDANGKDVIAVIGRVKPAGVCEASLEASLKNPEENVAFSVRSLTDDMWVGAVLHKHMKVAVTYDKVTEPGISCATKYNCPSLEALESSSGILTPAMLDQMQKDAAVGVALESGGMNVAMVKTQLGWSAVQKKHIIVPDNYASNGWK